MILDLSGLPQDSCYDVCVIGSGPAGSTVANELAGENLRVCVVESGLKRRSSFADALKQVEWAGLEIKEYSRERVVGGTSTTWAGLSSPLDSIDFRHKPWVPFSGWPLTRQELVPFYEAASARYRFPSLDKFDPAHWQHLPCRGVAHPELQTLETKVFLAAGEPQNFAHEFNAAYQTEQSDLILGATAVGLDGNAANGDAQSVTVRNEQLEKRIRAKVFVLAANGIENARLLLMSKFSCPSGLGNEHDQVGRYFMNHPKNYQGQIPLTKPIESLPAFFGFLDKGWAGYLGLRHPEHVQEAEQLLNSYVRFEPLFTWSHTPGVESLMYYVKRAKFLTRGFTRMHRDQAVELRDYAETGDDSDIQNQKKDLRGHLELAGNLLRYSPDVARYLFYRLVDAKRPRVRSVRIRNFMEMEPSPQNRVVLTERKDSFGNPLPSVEAEPSALDKRSMSAVQSALKTELASLGWGPLEDELREDMQPWPICADASHHLGTTRMGSDPQISVVDDQCRVHSCSNVYVAGGSVFPTSGNANPTFTVVALAIRLANHLLRDQLGCSNQESHSNITRANALADE